MTRFESAEDPGYVRVSGALKHWMNHLGEKYDAERECKFLDMCNAATMSLTITAIASTFSLQNLPSNIISSIPYKRNKDFVGQSEVIATIEKLFSEPDQGSSHAVLFGLGGIG